MTALAIALALFAQTPDAGGAPAEAPSAVAAAEDRLPAGAPRDDYQFVAWCYGALRGYIDMHDEMMPEVTRIETQFRKPGTNLADDLKVYAQMQKDGKAQLKTFQSTLTAAEKASVRPINTIGANAVRLGRQIWNTGPDVTKARKAQEWMSWSLPARCESVSASLENRAKLMGATFRVNEEPAAPEAAPAETPPVSPN
ncbi:MAG: hypothetical protein KKE02_22895 [Alphaproteobacteria bacterium]|nr:hypothetical protein [Alphaproteobacteria bacterium]MBU1516365.1 hypothetical protein [Alphaproteobacteria bacterium]MBU2093398.1 hypothetical protein [Alphaproteobacteria bacterium]MBU2153885.1 hypothetical protein [Alphaproteobacteria bacterium]MBU2307757.1 hypothetical protein [Alphaproteobacteria bacterium]